MLPGTLWKPTARSAEGLTETFTEAVLLPETGSNWLARTMAVAVTWPCTDGIAVMVAVATAPGLSAPRLKITVLPEIVAEPCEGVADVTATVAASRLLTTTLVAVLGPLLVTAME